MRGMLLVAGLISAGYAGKNATAADFGGFAPTPVPVTPLKDYAQIQREVNQNRMDQLRIQSMEMELQRQQQQQYQPQRQTYYCRTPGGDYVACR